VVVPNSWPGHRGIVSLASSSGGKGPSQREVAEALAHRLRGRIRRSGRPRHRGRHTETMGSRRSHRDSARWSRSSRVCLGPFKTDVLRARAPGEWCGCSRTHGEQAWPLTPAFISAINAYAVERLDAVESARSRVLLRKGPVRAIAQPLLSRDHQPGCICARLCRHRWDRCRRWCDCVYRHGRCSIA